MEKRDDARRQRKKLESPAVKKSKLASNYVSYYKMHDCNYTLHGTLYSYKYACSRVNIHGWICFDTAIMFSNIAWHW